jgi:hypothetical protein
MFDAEGGQIASHACSYHQKYSITTLSNEEEEKKSIFLYKQIDLLVIL